MKESWTPLDIKILTDMAGANERYTAKEMGEKLGRSRNSVIAKIRRMGIFWQNTRVQHKIRGSEQPKTVPLVKFFLHHGWVNASKR